MPKQIGRTIDLQEGREFSEQFSELNFTIRLERGELWLSTSHPSEYHNPLAEPAPEWVRFVGKDLGSSLVHTPKLPNRPVLLEPVQECKVLPGTRVTLYAFIPLFITFECNSRKLGEYPTRFLSDTWFGQPQSGELCYTVGTELVQQLSDDSHFGDYTAACPIRIRNKSTSELIIKTLCIRVQWLSLYTSQSRFITNETLITYRGEEIPSEIHVAAAAPGNSELVSAPRDTPPRSLSIRSFVSMLGL